MPLVYLTSLDLVAQTRWCMAAARIGADWNSVSVVSGVGVQEASILLPSAVVMLRDYGHPLHLFVLVEVVDLQLIALLYRHDIDEVAVEVSLLLQLLFELLLPALFPLLVFALSLMVLRGRSYPG